MKISLSREELEAIIEQHRQLRRLDHLLRQEGAAGRDQGSSVRLYKLNAPILFRASFMERVRRALRRAWAKVAM